MASLVKTEKKSYTPRKAWQVIVNREMCKECAFCLATCPTDVFAWSKTVNNMGWRPVEVVHEEHCIGCMICFQLCPDFCINVDEAA